MSPHRLFSNASLESNVVEYTTCGTGQIIILEARIDDMRFIFVNTYATNDIGERVNFFDSRKCTWHENVFFFIGLVCVTKGLKAQNCPKQLFTYFIPLKHANFGLRYDFLRRKRTYVWRGTALLKNFHDIKFSSFLQHLCNKQKTKYWKFRVTHTLTLTTHKHCLRHSDHE